MYSEDLSRRVLWFTRALLAFFLILLIIHVLVGG